MKKYSRFIFDLSKIIFILSKRIAQWRRFILDFSFFLRRCRVTNDYSYWYHDRW